MKSFGYKFIEFKNEYLREFVYDMPREGEVIGTGTRPRTENKSNVVDSWNKNYLNAQVLVHT